MRSHRLLLATAALAACSAPAASPDVSGPDAMPPPGLAVHAASVAEGQVGVIRAVFTVTLSPAETAPVQVDFTTAGDTATSGVDFAPAAGTLSFAPGDTEQTFTVEVRGDTDVEASSAPV